VDFDFSEEQYALRDLARELFEKESPPSRLRALWEGGARDTKVWEAMAGVGLLGLTIPEEFGGTGGNEVDVVLVLEEAGRAALPESYLETVAIAAPALAHANEKVRAEWLPRIAKGDATIAVQLHGTPFILDADTADLLVLEDSGSLYALQAGTFKTRQVKTEDRARRLFAVEADPASATSIDADAALAFDRAAAATAAVLNGISMHLLDATVEYVKQREQFGRPVGSFQAVKHKLATAFLLVESSRAAAWYAAYALANGLDDRSVAASIAKAYANDTAAFVNQEALQCHGGIGFTWEHDLHLWLKRGKALEQAYGSAREHRARLAQHLFTTGARDA
jgi:alkylation response protein AidB-like acyl-CoA dehydrogenase